MTRSTHLDEVIDAFMTDAEAIADGPVNRDTLGQMGARLAEFAESLSVGELKARFPAATPPDGEELHTLAVRSGPVPLGLYLVSDCNSDPGPAHEHTTWAVIVGLEGHEVNTFYDVVDGDDRTVRPLNSVTVPPGEVIVMLEDAIHATSVENGEPTYHLHLYGAPLSEILPPRARQFTVAS